MYLCKWSVRLSYHSMSRLLLFKHKIYRIFFFLDGSHDNIIIFLNINQQITKYGSTLALLSIAFPQMFILLFKCIEVAQELIMILYINTKLPLNFKNILDTLKLFPISYHLPDYLQYSHSASNDKKYVEKKFAENYDSSFFLDNSFNLIMISFILPWILILLIYIIQRFCSNWINKLIRIKSFLSSFWIFTKYNMVFLLYNNSLQELSLFSALELKTLSFSDTFVILSNIFCLVFLIGNFIMIIWMKKIIRNIIDNPYSPIQMEYESIFSNLNIENKYSIYFPLIIVIRKFILSFLIVFLYDNLFALLICLMILTIIIYLIIRINEPFVNKYQNIISEITELLQCCLYSLIFLYHQNKIPSSDEGGLYIGYISVIILSIIIALNFGMMIFNMFFSIIETVYKLNKIRTEIQIGDKISKTIDNLRMREFTYEKIVKDLKSGIWYKSSLCNKRMIRNKDKSTQYENPIFKKIILNDKNLNENNKSNDESSMKIIDDKHNLEITQFNKLFIPMEDIDENKRKINPEELTVDIDESNRKIIPELFAKSDENFNKHRKDLRKK